MEHLISSTGDFPPRADAPALAMQSGESAYGGRLSHAPNISTENGLSKTPVQIRGFLILPHT